MFAINLDPRYHKGPTALTVFQCLSFVQSPLYSHDFFVAGIIIVQELCESRGGRPGLSVLTSLLVSVDVKIY